ncbi:MAG: serine dehydratase beta chain, partial [Planctomycetota bacterium]
MPTISIFDMFKVGVGPSSSHTLGPWRIVQRFDRHVHRELNGAAPTRVRFEAMGSLCLTGKGHATDKALALAMLGEEPETVRLDSIAVSLETLSITHEATFAGHPVKFDPDADIAFVNERHPGHANAVRCFCLLSDGRELTRTYFSVGGGFVASADELDDTLGERPMPERPIKFGADLLRHCKDTGLPISRVVFENELAWWTETQIREQATDIWRVMRECIERGCTTQGVLPGGLNVRRRAHDLLAELGPDVAFNRGQSLAAMLRANPIDFESKLRLISCFALAVNEQNAAMGRVVTAPTNGAAGVIPAVMMYRDAFGPQSLSEASALR